MLSNINFNLWLLVASPKTFKIPLNIFPESGTLGKNNEGAGFSFTINQQ